MSRNRRHFSPHGRKFNERGVERVDDKWEIGLATDPIRTPKGALEELENARSFGTEIRGNVGTVMHNRANYQVSPNPNDFETYAEALLVNGSIYDAKGGPPATGDIFFTANARDYDNGELEDAKKAALNNSNTIDDYPKPWGYDFYQVNLSLSLPIYLGNLAVPPYKKYYPKQTQNGAQTFVVDKSGNTVSKLTNPTSADDFNDEIVGMYLFFGSSTTDSETYLGKRYLITSITDVDSLQIENSDDLPDGEYEFCAIHPRIHASYYMQSVQRMYYHAGEDIYEVPIPIFKWTRLNGITGRKPFPSDSLFHEIKGDLILTNDNGHYRVNINSVEGESHYWQINTARPAKARNSTKFFFGFPTSTFSNGENSYQPKGFSGIASDGSPDRLGGQILP